jgi:hypothetical protein
MIMTHKEEPILISLPKAERRGRWPLGSDLLIELNWAFTPIVERIGPVGVQVLGGNALMLSDEIGVPMFLTESASVTNDDTATQRYLSAADATKRTRVGMVCIFLIHAEIPSHFFFS